MRQSAAGKLNRAKDLLLQSFSQEILHLEMQPYKIEYKFIFHNHLTVYLQFNEFNEHSYLIQVSSKTLDRILYDHFDDQWNVKSKPNHYHPRFDKEGKPSPMKGDPDHDMPIFVKELKKYL